MISTSAVLSSGRPSAGHRAVVQDEKGYGRITDDDGEVPFVHFSAIESRATGRWSPGSG